MVLRHFGRDLDRETDFGDRLVILLLIDQGVRLADERRRGLLEVGQGALGAAALGDDFGGEGASKRKDGDHAHGGRFVPLDKQGGLFPRSGVFGARGETALVGGQVRLQRSHVWVAGARRQRHRFANHGAKGFGNAQAGKVRMLLREIERIEAPRRHQRDDFPRVIAQHRRAQRQDVVKDRAHHDVLGF